MENKEFIGSRLKDIRKYLRLTQKELAEKLDISDGYISDIEKGKKKPGRDLLEKLIERFNVNISYLFEGKGEYFYKSGQDQNEDTKPPSLIYNIGDVTQIEEEMKWAIDNIPVVKFALIEYYLSYLFKNQGMVKNEVEKYRQRRKDGKIKKIKQSTHL